VSRARALVTGATGFLGRHLADRLQERGFGVRALVRSEGAARAFEKRGMEAALGDLTDPDSLARACEVCAAVFHAAALPADPTAQRDVLLRVNAHGTQSLAAAAAAAGAEHLVFASSAVVYGLGPIHGAREDAAVMPHSAYSESKIEAEAVLDRFAREERLGVSIFRPYWVYGPGDLRFLPYLRRAVELEKIPLVDGGKALLDVIEVRDLADAMILAAKRSAPGCEIYNIADGGVHSIRNIIEAAALGMGREVRFSDVTIEFAREAVRSGLLPVTPELLDWVTRDHHLDTSRLRHDLGFHASVAFEEGMRRALAPA
jgi:nucleoside-diphosphate-sugar epimerase